VIGRACALTLAVLVTACAGRTPPLPGAAGEARWADHRAAAQRLVRWSFEGRVSVRGPNEGGSATLRWQESPEGAELRAMGPLGAGSFTLTRDSQGALLRTADGKQRHAAEVATLVQDAFGAQIPVDALAYWVRGLPAPGPVETLELDAHGRLAQLRQRGWDVEFSGYARSGALDLPARLQARSEPWEVRLAIRRWQLDGPL
jgi:outer membrane lipoprotein LolB